MSSPSDLSKWWSGRGASVVFAVAALAVTVRCVLPPATIDDRGTNPGDGGADGGGSACAGEAGCDFILAEGQDTPISVRNVNGLTYWLNRGDCKTATGKLMMTDDAKQPTTLATGIPCPNSLAVVKDTIYVSAAGMTTKDRAIWAVALNNPQAMPMLLPTAGRPSGLLAHGSRSTLYWSENDGVNVTFYSADPPDLAGTLSVVSRGPSALGDPLVFGVDDSSVYASSPADAGIYQSPLAAPDAGYTFVMTTNQAASDLVVFVPTGASPQITELVWIQPEGSVYRDRLGAAGVTRVAVGDGGGGHVGVDKTTDDVYFGTRSGQIWRVPADTTPNKMLRGSPPLGSAITSLDVTDTDVYFTDDGGNVIRISNR